MPIVQSFFPRDSTETGAVPRTRRRWEHAKTRKATLCYLVHGLTRLVGPCTLCKLLFSCFLRITRFTPCENEIQQQKYGTMSSPASRRSQRNSASVTPAHSTRSNRTAHPHGSQATPRASRQPNIPSSSPLFFNSSPSHGIVAAEGANGTNGINGLNGGGGIDVSSPLRQMSVADITPRGRAQAPGGDATTDILHPSSSDRTYRVIAYPLCL